MFIKRPSSGAARTSGRPVASQCARHLTNTVTSSENQSCITSMSSEPSSRSAWNSRSRPKQRGQQRADPQDRRADPRQQVEIRPDAEGNDGDHGEKEQHAEHRRRRRPGGDRQIAFEAAPSCPASPCRAVNARELQRPDILEPQRLVGGGDRHAACARCARTRSAKSCRSGCRAPPSAHRAATTAARDQQPRQRNAPLLAGGKIAERQMRHAGEPDRSIASSTLSPSHVLRRLETSFQKAEVFLTLSVRRFMALRCPPR
jgi:hypothetical protein